MQNPTGVRLLQGWMTTDHSPSAQVQDNENEDWSTTLPKKCWLADCEYTHQIDIEESTLSALQQESCAAVHLLRTQVHQRKKKRKNHTDDRREQLRRGSEDRPCTHSSIDWRRRRFLLIHSSLSGIIQSTTELFFKPQDTSDIGPAPGVEWRRKASVDRNDCVWCVCVMTRCQVAQGNQNKMAKLPRTSLRFFFLPWRSFFNFVLQKKPLRRGRQLFIGVLLVGNTSNSLSLPNSSALLLDACQEGLLLAPRGSTFGCFGMEKKNKKQKKKKFLFVYSFELAWFLVCI